MACKLTVSDERFAIAGGGFTISRGKKTHAHVVKVTLADGDAIGHGECVPYARYGESIESVKQQIEDLRESLEQGMTREELQSAIKPGAARNAIDCAIWDLDAKRAGKSVTDLADLPALQSVTTAYTLSLEEPDVMEENARKNADRPLLKVKLGSDGDLERIRAVRRGAPDSTIIVDANEGWSVDDYNMLAPEFVALNVAMVEQPFPAGEDEALRDLDRVLPVCADESAHDSTTIDQLIGKYDMINIKVDKTGGLTEALKLKKASEEAGLKIMVGCMLATSLAMAPALVVAQGADIVDLDGPLLLAEDREAKLEFSGSEILPPRTELWG